MSLDEENVSLVSKRLDMQGRKCVQGSSTETLRQEASLFCLWNFTSLETRIYDIS